MAPVAALVVFASVTVTGDTPQADTALAVDMAQMAAALTSVTSPTLQPTLLPTVAVGVVHAAIWLTVPPVSESA